MDCLVCNYPIYNLWCWRSLNKQVIVKHHYDFSIADTGITEQQHCWNKYQRKRSQMYCSHVQAISSQLLLGVEQKMDGLACTRRHSKLFDFYLFGLLILYSATPPSFGFPSRFQKDTAILQLRSEMAALKCSHTCCRLYFTCLQSWRPFDGVQRIRSQKRLHARYALPLPSVRHDCLVYDRTHDAPLDRCLPRYLLLLRLFLWPSSALLQPSQPCCISDRNLHHSTACCIPLHTSLTYHPCRHNMHTGATSVTDMCSNSPLSLPGSHSIALLMLWWT